MKPPHALVKPPRAFNLRSPEIREFQKNFREIIGQIKGIVVGNTGGKLSEADQETVKVLAQQLKDLAEEAQDQGISLPR